MMRRTPFHIWILIGVLSPVLAHAEFSLVDEGGLHAGLSLQTGTAGFAIHNLNYFGDSEQDKTFFDGFFKPILNASYRSAATGELYGGVSWAATGTYGDDIAGLSMGDSEGFKSEQAYIGWKSGSLFESLGDNALDISVGEQEFAIGDGFLIYDGEFDGRFGAYWTAPHQSFDKTAIVRINTKPIRADLFYLKADDDYANTELSGINVEFSDETLGTVGATYMNVANSDAGTGFTNFDSRKGLNVYSVRGQGSPLTRVGLPNLFLAFEYGVETGGDRADKDASAWYAELTYTLADIRWHPALTYKYAFFSGDEDVTDNDDENWDPMFYGTSRGWGNHTMGEIVGEYLLFNSNQKTQMVKFNLQPTERLSVGVIYYDFRLDERNVYGTPVASDRFADEINVYADFAVSDKLWMTAVFAFARPESAWEEVNGGSASNTTLFQVAAFLFF